MKRLICSGISALLTIAFAGSVFGAEIDITNVNVLTDGTVSAEVSVTDPAEGAQYSVIVMKKADDGSYSFDDTVYINQLAEGEYSETDSGVSFTIVFAPDESGKYVLKVGTTDELAPDEYGFPNEETDDPDDPTPTPEVELYGDADLSGVLTANDAACVLKDVIDSEYQVLAEFEVVDVNGDGEITAADAASILSKVLNAENKFDVETE